MSKNEAVFADATPLIRITPGESNSAREERERAENVRKEQHKRSMQSSGLELPEIGEKALEMRIRDFLVSQHSPLVESVPGLIATAESHGIDPRLIAGIAGAESTFGLHMPTDAHNPFGLGPNRVFSSFDEAYQAESDFLQAHFGSRNTYDPFKIGPSYTGTGSTTWGPSVARVMAAI